MNELQIFKNEQFGEIRTLEVDNEIHFVAKDVCKALDIKNTTDAIKRLDDDEVTRFNLGGLSGETNLINEYGLYNLVLASRKKEAKDFKRWVTHEVIPSIRKHGGYLTNQKIEEALLNPDTLIQLATTLKEERTKRLVAEQRVMELQPKASYYDLILQNKTLLSVSQIAKDYGKSPQWLNNKLSDLKIQYKQGGVWLLYQKYAEHGYTQSTTHPIDDERSKLLTKWTQKGRLFLYETLKSIGILPVIEQ